MKPWTIAEVYRLARTIAAAGESFYARRLLERRERGELTIGEAAACCTTVNAPTVSGRSLVAYATPDRVGQSLGSSHAKVQETQLRSIRPDSVGPLPREGEQDLVVDHERQP